MPNETTVRCPWCGGAGCLGCAGAGELPSDALITKYTWSYTFPYRPPGLEDIFQTAIKDVTAAMAVVAKRGLRSDGQLLFLRETHSLSQNYMDAQK